MMHTYNHERDVEQWENQNGKLKYKAKTLKQLQTCSFFGK